MNSTKYYILNYAEKTMIGPFTGCIEVMTALPVLMQPWLRAVNFVEFDIMEQDTKKIVTHEFTEDTDKSWSHSSPVKS